MRLLVISHTPHYRGPAGLTGWGPTVREIDELASLCDSLVHVAPLHEEAAPESSLAYGNPKVRLRQVRPAGGSSLLAKASILTTLPGYWQAITEEMANADAVHVRCPANISLIALLALWMKKHPAKRWVKYAGNWRPEQADPLSYRLQRYMLRFPGIAPKVSINGWWPGQAEHVASFHNPSLTDQEMEEGKEAAAGKHLEGPVRLAFAGRLESAKGVEQVLEILIDCLRAGFPAELDLVGDGPLAPSLRQRAEAAGCGEMVKFHGWLPRPALAKVLRQAHIFVLPSVNEGWPKVLSEGMAYGVVPLASPVGSIKQYLEWLKTGRAIPASDRSAYVSAIGEYIARPEIWKLESDRAVQSAEYFSYRYYRARVAELFGIEAFGSGLPVLAAEAQAGQAGRNSQ